MTATPITSALTPDQAARRIDTLTVIDVRTPGEYASGHLPQALNIPLDDLRAALPDLKAAADRGDLLIVCASGNRSAQACATLAAEGLGAATLTGGTTEWARLGYALDRPEGGRAVWAMERQVRLAAGSMVLAGLLAGRRWGGARWVSAGIAGGLVFSAVTNTCGMAQVLSRLPHNRARACDLNTARDALRAPGAPVE
ncbi:rhodanese-like domain-containing protein [Streptomyces sp. NPDC049906]|uniref:rhodanese-like domain-containing protein n=1 Tax=Streptomyces sp. NPDC049906 TaxID=3155656 RepID=UPI00342A79EB